MGIPDSGISLMGVVITGPIKRAVIAGSYTPLYTARVVACSRNWARSGNSDGLVREQVSPLAVVPHNPFFRKEINLLILTIFSVKLSSIAEKNTKRS